MALDPRILVSLHGKRVGLTKGGHLVEDDHIMVPSWRDRIGRSVLYDGFNGPVMDANKWLSFKGSDGSAAFFANADVVGGVVRGTTGAGASTMAVNGTQLNGWLNWQANQSGLELTLAVKAAAVTNLSLFVGFSDQISALEQPFTMSGTTLTSNCTDGCGFLLDTAATAATTWKAVSVANDVDGTTLETGLVAVAATYDLVTIELDVLGNANFWLNGNLIYQQGIAVTPTIALTPYVSAFRRTTASTTVDVDAIYCAQDR